MKNYWRLPRGVDEVLPPLAWELELLRRRALDVLVSWGFDYIEPPVVEFLDSLLVGSGEDLDLQTLKVVDQVSGRQLGLRADMTSQAVRIDAHSRPKAGVQRLCYAGPVVFANPQTGAQSRVPFKAGAEIFGSASLAADAEVVALMLEVLKQAQVEKPVLLLGHMGIYLGLAGRLLETGELAEDDAPALFESIQRKGESDIRNLLGNSSTALMMSALPNLMGGREVISQAAQVLEKAPEGVQTAIAELDELAATIAERHPDVDLRIDVAELSGYGYHNGPVFAVYHPRHGRALAQGGRYDGIGKIFGRGRPATGFDIDLKLLLEDSMTNTNPYVYAPYVEAALRPGLEAAVAALRAQGQRVAMACSPDECGPDDCMGVLRQVEGEWQIQPC
ncbi:MAG: ATP phosphoribosyltransferase regulatory subunit [OM182 bacterium]|nr:MAG: ATP phosphoribosyltransferase regulatory subunit [OM182 bacterium]